MATIQTYIRRPGVSVKSPLLLVIDGVPACELPITIVAGRLSATVTQLLGRKRQTGRLPVENRQKPATRSGIRVAAGDELRRRRPPWFPPRSARAPCRPAVIA